MVSMAMFNIILKTTHNLKIYFLAADPAFYDVYIKLFSFDLGDDLLNRFPA